MDNNSKEDKQSLPYDKEDVFNINNTASANDCTGLIPTPPKDGKEADSYVEIYKIPKPQRENAQDVEKRASSAQEGEF